MDLLKVLQEDLPLVERPFKEVALKLGTSEEKVIEEIKKLKSEKVIRQISPIYDTKRAGYDSSLVAFKVENEKIEEVAKFINTYPGVSHNYEREGDFNLWFTIAVPPDSKYGLDEIVRKIAERMNVEDYAILRTKRTFKIRVNLSFESLYEREEKLQKVQESEPVELSEIEKQVIRETQEDIPLVEKPFELIAQKLGISQEEVLKVLKNLKEKKVMKRFSAILYHRNAGFKANGMSVWKVEKDIEEVGNFFASFKAVSHCYERTTNGKWNFNLFAMIHGRKKDEVIEFCEFLSKETGIKDYEVLFSKREFKKKRVKLFSKEFYEWEENL